MVPLILTLPNVFQYPLGILLFVLSLFLILLILVQRGRGGGLTGALGGMGGQSAFGSKAGDLFTRVTVVVAAVWILLCCLLIVSYTGKGFANYGETRKPSAADDNSSLTKPPIEEKGTGGEAGNEAGTTESAAPAGKGDSGSKNGTSSKE